MPAELPDSVTSPLTVVGIGADGWDGLHTEARAAIRDAEVLLGGSRHLALVGDVDAHKVAWPSPLLPALDAVLAEHAGSRLCVLASGDPLRSGIAGTLVRRYGSANLRIIPALSSVTLARARLGWTAEETGVVNVVGRNISKLRRELTPGRRLLVLSEHERTPEAVAELLVTAGYAASELTVLEALGGPDERRFTARAHAFGTPRVGALNIVAIDCVADDDTQALSSVPGLPDEAYETDGQLTKRALRASTLAILQPLPGQLLWDIGAGSGSVAIEWCRAHPDNRAIAIERDPRRCERIERNADNLGVTGIRVVHASVPHGLAGLDTPDAVFVGGGLTATGTIDACWDALASGGVLAANGVTLEAEQALAAARARWGGALTRLTVQHAEPLGGFTGWTPARTVTQWHARKSTTRTQTREHP